MPGFDDTFLQQAEDALIQQLNNISHDLEIPILQIWTWVNEYLGLEAISVRMGRQDRIAEVAMAAVKALYSICACQMPHQQVWDYISHSEEFNSWE